MHLNCPYFNQNGSTDFIYILLDNYIQPINHTIYQSSLLTNSVVIDKLPLNVNLDAGPNFAESEIYFYHRAVSTAFAGDEKDIVLITK